MAFSFEGVFMGKMSTKIEVFAYCSVRTKKLTNIKVRNGVKIGFIINVWIHSIWQIRTSIFLILDTNLWSWPLSMIFIAIWWLIGCSYYYCIGQFFYAAVQLRSLISPSFCLLVCCCKSFGQKGHISVIQNKEILSDSVLTQSGSWSERWQVFINL